MDFKEFKTLQQTHVAKMVKDATHLFEISLNKDALYELYLSSFPKGTNEIFRNRREFDCSCCRTFIKNIGNAVTIKDNKITTIWDFETNDTTFQPVINALSKFIKSHLVSDIYVTKEKKIGTDKNFEKLADGKITEWQHFFIDLDSKFVDTSGKSEGDIKGEFRDTRNVFKRSLDEITEESLLTVLELISQNSLYKGEEWKAVLTEFLKYKKQYDKTKPEQKENYTWEQSVKVGGSIGRIKNHSIGTLLINISEGMDLDLAVKKYEAIVAPSNYMRPQAIFTKKMLEDAKKTIQELGYMDSLNRRFATLEDITINNILFSNKDSAKRISGSDIFDEMSSNISVNPKKFSKVEEVSVDNFINNILPTVKELEVFLENKHTSNMVSLIAPENKDAKTMFKWDNGFTWAYSGNITDSDLTERVKAAGGRTDGVLRFSHSWNYEGIRNGSLMDLHVFMPGSNQSVTIKNGKEVHDNYGNDKRVGWNHRNHHESGGVQDVDYTAVAPVGYIPVENITFPSIDSLKEGIYIFKNHNWSLRQPTTGGFKAEVAFDGRIYKFERKEALGNKEWVTLAKLELKNGKFNILEMMKNDTTPIEVWGIKTNQFVPVSVVCYSPNYWNEQDGVGHKHYMFMLKNCINSELPNGFFNEFLKQDLVQHKKVFEALGAKMAVKDINDQLSGVAFSSTKRNDLLVKVKGQSERVIKIKF